MEINIQIDTSTVRAQLVGLERQIPFVVSKALNSVANDGQRAVQDSLSAHFTLRRGEFIRRTIKRQTPGDFATKTNLQAIVRVDPQRDFLEKFEEDSEKVPQRGRKMIAIPTAAVRRTKSDIIRAADRPRAILSQVNQDAGRAFILNGAIYRVIGRGRRALLQKVYTLKARVGIRARLRFRETVNTAVDRQWEARALEAIDRALATLR